MTSCHQMGINSCVSWFFFHSAFDAECEQSSLVLIECFTSLLYITALPHFINPGVGEVWHLWCASPCPETRSTPGPCLWTSSSFLGLLDPEDLSQVLSSDLLAMDLLYYPAREPAPFTIVKPFTHHPAYNTRQRKIRGDVEMSFVHGSASLWQILWNNVRQ